MITLTESDIPTVLFMNNNKGFEWKSKSIHPGDELIKRRDYHEKMMSHVEDLLDQARGYDEKGYVAFASDCREMAYYIWTHILGKDRDKFSHEYADLIDELSGAEWLKDIEKSDKAEKDSKGDTQ